MESNKKFAEFLGFVEVPELKKVENSDLNYHDSLDWMLPIISKMYNNGNKPNAIVTIKPKKTFIDVYNEDGLSHTIVKSGKSMIDNTYYCISVYIDEINDLK